MDDATIELVCGCLRKCLASGLALPLMVEEDPSQPGMIYVGAPTAEPEVPKSEPEHP